MMYFNPYTGANFWEFFQILFWRIVSFVQGKLSIAHLAADEIQLLVLIGIGASAALIGTFLVLRKMTMVANSLSHTILLGIIIAFILSQKGGASEIEHGETIPIQAMLWASLGMALITSFLTQFLVKSVRLQEDASIGIVFTALFAIGVIFVTLLTRNAHIGTEVVMGNVDALHWDDCKLAYLILAFNSVILLAFFKEFKITTFDAGLASLFGISPLFFNYLLMVQASATIVGAFRAVGILMVLAFITGPVITARLLVNRLETLLIAAVGLSALASLIGVALARHILSVYSLPLSTGGIVVCAILGLFVFVVLMKMGRQKLVVNTLSYTREK